MSVHGLPGQDQGAPNASAGDELGAQERWQRIAVAAFYRAEARGFAPGHELEDWLAAERQLVAAAAVAGPRTAAAHDAAPAPAAPVRRRRESTQKRAVTPRKKAATARKTATRTRSTEPGMGTDVGGKT